MNQEHNKPAKVLGFSLVELMAAAAIMGILVSLALPRYRLFMARSRMAEAKINLGIIYGLQQTYKAEFEEYGNINGDMGCVGMGTKKCETTTAGEQAKNELGFRVTNCNALRYLYATSGASASARSDGDGTCEIYPNCDPAKEDRWEILSTRKLNHHTSVIKACSD